MTHRSLFAAAALAGACGSLALGLTATQNREAVRPAAPAAVTRVLPGIQPGGEVRLPNQWSLRPAGRQVALGDFPVNLALHPSGRWLAILHAGYGTHEVAIFDTDKPQQKVVSRVMMD